MSSKTKRTLYKPVPNIVPKKNRKSLAQGRLITERNGTDAKWKSSKEEREDNNITVTPRKNISRIDEQKSPRPTPTLDLSDLDIEIVDNKLDRSVIVIDASDNHLNPDKSEVKVKIGVEKSPVRIVCHVNNQTMREIDHEVSQDAGVKVQLHPSTPQAISPLVKDLPKSARKTPMSKQMTTPRQNKPNYPQPNFNDSQESLKGDEKVKLDSVQDDDDVHSIISDAYSLDEYLPVIKSKSKNQTATSKNTSLKHKTAASIIPSRYMQTAAKSSSSFTNQKNISSRKVNSNTSNKSVRTATPTQISKNTSTASQRAVTPSLPTQSAGGKTSTPCSNEALPNQSQDIDASAIHADISAIAVDLSTLISLSHSRKMNSSGIAKKNRPKKQDVKMSQQKLELQYSRYLQWLYLDSKAKTVFKEQEKTAISQLHSLWEQVKECHDREASLKLELARLKHQNLLEEQLDLQRTGLAPVVLNLPVVDQEYHKLAESLDTTRHQVSTKGIYVPEDEDIFQDSLERALKESEYLLGEISVMVRQEVPKTSQFSNSLQTTQKLVDAECSELRKCTELLSATQSLTIQESSLKIQAIQSQ